MKETIFKFNDYYNINQLNGVIDIVHKIRKEILNNIYFPLLLLTFYLEVQNELKNEKISKVFNFNNYTNY